MGLPDLVDALRAEGTELSIEAANEIVTLRTLLDQDLTFKDLEMHMRDGSLNIKAVDGMEGGNPIYRTVAAMLLHLLLGDDNELPPNYRMVEWALRPASEQEEVRMVGEIVRSGHKSSHEMRLVLEQVLLDCAVAARHAHDTPGVDLSSIIESKVNDALRQWPHPEET